jgi:hypothetical protein
MKRDDRADSLSLSQSLSHHAPVSLVGVDKARSSHDSDDDHDDGVRFGLR